MSLDVMYYAGYELVISPADSSDAGWWDNIIDLRGFQGLGALDRSDRLFGCVFRAVGEGRGFHAGSYSNWRAHLCRLIHNVEPVRVWGLTDLERLAHQGNPYEAFYELIVASDSRGVFGPVTSAKLAGDFHAHVDKASGDQLYLAFMTAFTTAANTGFVRFQ